MTSDVTTARELRETVDSLLQRGRPVRARGTRRGLGDLGDRVEAQVDMRGLRRVGVTNITIEGEARSVVRAEAGATVAEVLAALQPHDLTLPNLPGYA